MMIVNISIIFFFVLCCDQTLYVNAISVVISQNLSGYEAGLLGNNGTELECSYTLGSYRQFSVSFWAFNKNSKTFEQIAIYIQDLTPLINTKGQYLKGRVTLTPITHISTKAVMTFNKLMCIDDRFYKCKVNYIDSNGNHNPISNNISISVLVPPSKPEMSENCSYYRTSNLAFQVTADDNNAMSTKKYYRKLATITAPVVPPSKPDRVSLVHTPADSSVTTTKHMDYTTSFPSTAVTSNENNTVSASKMKNQNTTTAFNHSTIQTTGHNTTTSSPSNISYRTTSYAIQQTTTEQGIAEGDNITVVCTGDVGNPPAEHFFQKNFDGHTIRVTYTASATSKIEISENCSYYRTSNLTFQVKAEDNNAVIRCVVNSSMAEPDMYVETAPIKVYYEVSMPTIIKYPNKAYYVVGEDTSIHLTCYSNGNPKPNYHWYKENHNELISTSESWTITYMNVTNSGVYTCNVSNTFNGDKYRTAKNVQINIMNKANEAPSTTFKTSVSNKTSVVKQSNNGNTTVIVVGTVCGLIILVLCVISFGVIYNKNKTFRCLLRRNRNDRSVDYVNTIQQQDPSLYEGVGQDLHVDEHNYEQLSRREHLYNNTNFSNN